ncbi:DUF805 domain-containing protein [Rufibacter tibetensis]|uniref:DUF805 domain-containing protein n=1 Tax=Rufibacter tibetensis TaxID=512763 RepID=A0A0P0C478_9BACT|nr:DUF805 domain-containing protein [Rufibacter tibetensis]ALI99932.1 hypothetical protein DC20_14320 [Rufibacter tibetensis]
MFKAPFSFKGRIRRLEYGLSWLIYIPFAIILNVLAASSDITTILIMFVLYIPLVWFVWAQGAKRCHDKGRSGWFQIIPFYCLVLLFSDGEPYENDYGANPKGKEEQAADFFNQEPVME